MRPFWTDAQRWRRIAVVASAVWFGGVWIIAAIHNRGSMNDFSWISWKGGLGPATVTAVVGIAIIVALCFGIPWIARPSKVD